ncbi:Pcm Protein-L-isoaspartate carboxylmethyltransferase [Rhabdaerophilaceae bacterium]
MHATLDGLGQGTRKLKDGEAFRPSGRSGAPDEALARFLLSLRSRGLTEPLLFNAFERIPRAAFVQHVSAGLLYEPINLPIACGEESEDPFSLARLLLLAKIAPGQRVLEIGTGSGFSAALMAAIGAEVVTLERYAQLGMAASRAFNALDLSKITILQADGLAKRVIGGPFDRLILGGALDLVPHSLFEGLVPGGIAIGGRMRANHCRLTHWRIDASGFPVETDMGPARMNMLRQGLPIAL